MSVDNSLANSQMEHYDRQAKYQQEEAVRFEAAVTNAGKKRYHEAMARYYSILCEKAQHCAKPETLDVSIVDSLGEECARCAVQYGHVDETRTLMTAVSAGKLTKEEAQFIVMNGIARQVDPAELA